VRQAILIYNPASGQNREKRSELVLRAAEVLRDAGVEVQTCATTGSGSAIVQAQQAVESGFDTIIACGGDGTVNEVLNGVMTAATDTAPAIGVIPLGSGNLLATDLLLPRRPEAAARALLRYQPRELHPGVITYQTKKGERRRYFIIAAGVGADAELMYRTAKGGKERWGIYAYFLEMARMALTRDFPMFEVDWMDREGARHKDTIALVMALRAHRFPGLLRRVRLGSALLRNDYRLMLFRTNRIWRFMSFFFSVATGWNWKVSRIDLAYSTWFRCAPIGTPDAKTKTIHCETDGESLGRLPVEVAVEQRRFRLLMPEESN
jgi:diacylglycerol kinase family enzyme